MSMTVDEKHVLDLSVLLWEAFLKLPTTHPDEQDEFRSKLHDLQRIIMVRQVGAASKPSIIPDADLIKLFNNAIENKRIRLTSVWLEIPSGSYFHYVVLNDGFDTPHSEVVQVHCSFELAAWAKEKIESESKT